MTGALTNTAVRIVDHPVLGPLPETRMVTVIFDGQAISAREGEPVAAALLAAGVRVFHRMPQTGEARGGYCMIGRCSDCLVVIDDVPNVRACLTPVRDGMTVMTQHGFGDQTRTEVSS